MGFFAYIGPGAGFAFFSSAILLFVSAFILILAAVAVPFRWTKTLLKKLLPGKKSRYTVYVLIGFTLIGLAGYSVSGWFTKPNHKTMVVLGMDGLDPSIVRKMMAENKLPNFARLRERGDFSELDVPNPPISPTSWASFITGSNPGKHGVLGFIGRDRSDYSPQLFTHVTTAQTFLNLPENLQLPGPYRLPLFPRNFQSELKATAFWKITSREGIPSTMVRVPVTFPPESLSGNGKMLSGLGTPDLRGTQGSYSLWQKQTIDEETSAGELQKIQFFSNRSQSNIKGPGNPLLDSPRPVKIPLGIQRTDSGAYLSIKQQPRFFLREKDWSSWKDLTFPLGLGMDVTGIARFHLNDTEPFQLYMTPIQIDPRDPVMAISTPESYAPHLAKRIGRFYTMGMAQDDKALKEESISDTTFLQQAYQGLRERRRILGIELRDPDNSLIVGVFDTLDRVQHLYWRARDPKHPLYDENQATVAASAIPRIYKKMDEILGEVLDATDNRTPILVVSDHGFTSFRRQFHVNDWLRKNDYLNVHESRMKSAGRFFQTENDQSYVDWNRTTAYQIGLTGIYLNVKGREINGTVPAEKKWERAETIANELEQVIDPKTGKHVFSNVFLGKEIFEGLRWQDGPDLILGYNRGYRTSWYSGRGEIYGRGILSDNLNKWSGDHVIDSQLVPGSFFSTHPISEKNPSIMDIAPTVLRFYGIEPPETMDGEALFEVPRP